MIHDSPNILDRFFIVELGHYWILDNSMQQKGEYLRKLNIDPA